MGKNYLLSAIIGFFSVCALNYNPVHAQSLIDFSKYKISMLSKNQKQNCSSWGITIPIDFNKDGLIDFVTTGDDMGPCSTNGEITYLNFFENDGLDNFIEKTTKYAKDSLWSIRPTWYLVEDFNSDGKKDIFITGEQIHGQWNNNYLKAYPFLKPGVDIDTSNNFSFIQRRHHIYLSQSDGTFKDSPDFLQGMRLGSTFGITAVDYNKDGYMDLVNAVQQFSNNDKVLPSGWDVEIYLNNSGKSMTRKTPFTVRGAIDANNNTFNKSRIDSIGGNSEGPENIKFYDVNNDGYLDMIFNDRDGNALCMLSQKKELDLYSPVIKFDDYQTNGLLINMPGSKIGIRGFYLVDIKNNGTQQLIEYWANGDGDYQPGKKLYQLIKIFEIKDGGFVDATNSYFNLNENINKTYGFSTLNLIDIDNDGFIDLFPKGLNQDGKGYQGFNGSDSTMYYKNINGKFSLKSIGLKYYFKEFKELADSMKVFDPLHKFSIANNLIPINTGKSNKLIFYSYATEPGIDRSGQNFPNDILLNKQKKVYNDSLTTYSKGFILAPFNCNPQKPIFTSSRISFPIGDSLKLTVSNVYKADTLKWYYGSKTDFTNVSSKTFTDSTKLFVTRTDSLGCVISSDTIKITTYPKQQITTKFRTFKFNLSSYKDAAPNIGQKMHQAICQTVLYYFNGIEHIVTIPVDSVPNAPIHFINKNGNWELQSFYPNFKMDAARNYSFIDTLGNFAYANTGSEVPKPWPLGDVVLVNTINDTLKWTKANTVKAFYHSVGTGDLNGDGLTDLVGLHMQSNYWGDNLHPFLQNANGTFSEGRNIISAEVGARRNSSGAVLVTDLLGDAKPEIVRGSYGFTGANGEARYAFEILGFNKQSNQYVKVYEPKKLGVFTDIVNGGQGATSIKSADFDHNGFQDLVICSEGSLPNSSTKGASMIQIWLNNGKGEFIPDQYIINNADDSLNIREFEVADIDKDGWPDIVMHGIGGALYRGLVPSSKFGTYFKINNLIWKNNRGVFDILPNQLNVYDSTNIELIGNSNFLKGFMVNGKLKFVGFENADANNQTKLYEITVNFCNNLIKPTFSNAKYSFCSGDSLKLTVSNVNKGDTLKWYYGTKSDLTNVSNKTFADSTKLFVTRTDSLGCVISSDTIQIKKYGIPSAPTLSRDTANFLLSGAMGTTWYKDGSAITDTAQKYKPTTAGSYTAKTTTNGCTSVMSAAYYYLVTDIINLSKDEFIKLAPNPFINQLNFDFIVKGYQRLNLEVFDIATGTKVASQPNLTAGSRITLGQLSAGSYVIKITSTDNKISYQFKMVKL